MRGTACRQHGETARPSAALSCMLLVSPGLNTLLFAEPRPVSPTSRSQRSFQPGPGLMPKGDAWVPCSVPERALFHPLPSPAQG